MKKLLAALVITALCGLPLRADSPQPFFNGSVVATVLNVKTAPGGLYGFVLQNTAATLCYLQVFNATAANVTPGTTVPALSLPVNISSTTIPGITALSLGNSPVAFNTAISIAGTTTATGATPCGTGLIVNILFL